MERRVTVGKAAIAAILFCRECSFTGFSSKYCDEYYLEKAITTVSYDWQPLSHTKQTRCTFHAEVLLKKLKGIKFRTFFFFPSSLQREDYLYEIQVLTLAVSKYPQRLSIANEEKQSFDGYSDTQNVTEKNKSTRKMQTASKNCDRIRST